MLEKFPFRFFEIGKNASRVLGSQFRRFVRTSIDNDLDTTKDESAFAQSSCRTGSVLDHNLEHQIAIVVFGSSRHTKSLFCAVQTLELVCYKFG